jgi:hypothetical protein
MTLREGKALTAEERDAAAGRAREFVKATNLGYVVIDRTRASDELSAYAVRTLTLEYVGSADGRDLYHTGPTAEYWRSAAAGPRTPPHS